MLLQGLEGLPAAERLDRYLRQDGAQGTFPISLLPESADPSHQHVLDLLAEMLAVDRTVIADEDDDDDDDDDEHILE